MAFEISKFSRVHLEPVQARLHIYLVNHLIQNESYDTWHLDRLTAP